MGKVSEKKRGGSNAEKGESVLTDSPLKHFAVDYTLLLFRLRCVGVRAADLVCAARAGARCEVHCR